MGLGAAFDKDRSGEILVAGRDPISTRGMIIGHLEGAKPDRETDLGAVLQSLGDQIKKRGLIIIISDLLTDLTTFFDGLARLQHRGNEILVLQVLDRDEMELPFNDYVQFRDIEGTEEFFAEPWSFAAKLYCAAMQQFVAEVTEGCGNRGVDHLLLRTDQDPAAALSHYLHVRERVQQVQPRGRG